MKRYQGYLLVLFLIFCWGCTSSSSSGGGGVNPAPNQNAAGVWLGNFYDIFTIGIITDDYNARFIGDRNQYIGTVDVSTTVLTGELSACIWTTTGDVSYKADNMDLGMTGFIAENSLLWGAFYSANTTDQGFSFVYNTTYEVSPNVENISGQWDFTNEWHSGNTLVLTITPSIHNTTDGTIMGNDTLSNTFTGTISIHYSPPGKSPKNVYDVQLQLNNTISLAGLATYVLEYTEAGKNNGKTLAIGATSDDLSYLLNGLATQ